MQTKSGLAVVASAQAQFDLAVVVVRSPKGDGGATAHDLVQPLRLKDHATLAPSPQPSPAGERVLFSGSRLAGEGARTTGSLGS
jgi:hypothetical protein